MLKKSASMKKVEAQAKVEIKRGRFQVPSATGE